jgi:hypothetical protein
MAISTWRRKHMLGAHESVTLFAIPNRTRSVRHYAVRKLPSIHVTVQISDTQWQLPNRPQEHSTSSISLGCHLERFEWAVHGENREASLARHRLNPVTAPEAVWLLRAEVNRLRSVGTCFGGPATNTSGCRRACNAAACEASSLFGCRTP